MRVQRLKLPQLANRVVIVLYLLLGRGRVEGVCADEVAEEVGSGEFCGGMEAFEDEFVVFELCCFEESMVEDTDYERVEALRDEGYGEEFEGAECGEYGDEDLVGERANSSGFNHLVDLHCKREKKNKEIIPSRGRESRKLVVFLYQIEMGINMGVGIGRIKPPRSIYLCIGLRPDILRCPEVSGQSAPS